MADFFLIGIFFGILKKRWYFHAIKKRIPPDEGQTEKKDIYRFSLSVLKRTDPHLKNLR
jgi:hypothetical protein